jgi:hypothetical protein
VGPGEQVKLQLSQALTRDVRPDSNSRPTVQISSSLSSHHVSCGHVVRTSFMSKPSECLQVEKKRKKNQKGKCMQVIRNWGDEKIMINCCWCHEFVIRIFSGGGLFSINIYD